MTWGGDKAAGRKFAAARRAAAHGTVDPRPAQAALAACLARHRGAVVSGYMPIRTEIDPLPVMAELSAHGPVCVPVIEGAGLSLRFRRWTPGCALEEGPFGARVPSFGPDLVPEVLIVPLLAFDGDGYRLGYGGGFYDRTLAGLREQGRAFAIGFAYAAQEAARVPREATDQPLDAIVTETGLRDFGARQAP